jgi:hypothetical protein
MNTTQRLIGVVGSLLIMLVACYPSWDVAGRVQYSFEETLDDSGKADYYSSVIDFHKQVRSCLFSTHGEPTVPYTPPPERRYDAKRGYSTKTLIGTTLVDYTWIMNVEQMLVGLLVFLIPTILLLIVFKSRKED